MKTDGKEVYPSEDVRVSFSNPVTLYENSSLDFQAASVFYAAALPEGSERNSTFFSV